MSNNVLYNKIEALRCKIRRILYHLRNIRCIPKRVGYNGKLERTEIDE